MIRSEQDSRRRARLIARELQLGISSPHHTLHFHGESMRPLLIEGDEVVVEPVAWDRIRRGDIITYRYRDRFPTRRVIRKTDTGLELWCDNWPDRSFTAARGDVLGRAIARRRDWVWLTARDGEWARARRSALRRYLQLVVFPPLYLRARSAAGLVLRKLGLRRRSAGR